MTFRAFCAGAFICAASAISAQTAEELSEARAAFEAGLPDGVIEIFQGAADQGNSEAIFLLGRAHALGLGVEQDHEKAAELFQKATEMNNAEAMVALSDAYVYREGVGEDLGKSIGLLRRAAKLGNVTAVSDLGWMYDHGYGVKSDALAALALYRLAAERGSEYGALNLAFMLVEDARVEADPARGWGWCLVSLERVSPLDREDFSESCDELGEMVDAEAQAAGAAWAEAYLQ